MTDTLWQRDEIESPCVKICVGGSFQWSLI